MRDGRANLTAAPDGLDMRPRLPWIRTSPNASDLRGRWLPLRIALSHHSLLRGSAAKSLDKSSDWSSYAQLQMERPGPRRRRCRNTGRFPKAQGRTTVAGGHDHMPCDPAGIATGQKPNSQSNVLRPGKTILLKKMVPCRSIRNVDGSPTVGGAAASGSAIANASKGISIRFKELPLFAY